MKIGIIGGGASGMAAAIWAATSGNEVLLFERQARVGRKLLSTGNGRCNLTNTKLDFCNYHGDEPNFAKYALDSFHVSRTLRWFDSLGLYTVTEPSGRVYPYSDQANSVVDVLRFALQRKNVQVLTDFEVTKARKTNDGFLVESKNGQYLCDRLIIACGGLAGTKLGGTMSGYQLLRSFGHHATKLRPALVQLKSGWQGCASLKGVRANCHAEIYHNGQLHSQSTGELQFTQYGLSGPVIFEISRDACQGSGEWVCKLDFLPGISEKQLEHNLRCRQAHELPAEDFLTGILHNRLGRILMQAAQIRGDRPSVTLTEAEIHGLCRIIKGFEISLTEPMGMDSAQVTAGGILTAEFDPETMESRLVPGLYACGEVLDIDGDCGGYNLQWAWSSGALAGTAAGGMR
ncbi:MAG: NAD(P)/FAD-dependent oxidoreductase [Oscillospiraceae bacterium]|nr:NAD(P)/FAD-dependent oxidoreductase [Oscillospiraceae bacterium]